MEEPAGPAYGSQQVFIPITGWQWAHYIHHNVREPVVRDVEVAGVDQFLIRFNFFARYATFNKGLHVFLKGWPIVLLAHSFICRLDGRMV